MVQLIEANTAAFVLALVIGLLVAWWLLRRQSRGPERTYRPDVLDEGVAPAARNQTLIDSPPAAVGLAGIGEIVAVAAQDAMEAASDPSELSRIKGVGPKLVAALSALGVTRLAQVAAWDEAEVDRIDGQLGTFAGRIRRDQWVEQARLLEAGDVAAFERTFGKL